MEELNEKTRQKFVEIEEIAPPDVEYKDEAAGEEPEPQAPVACQKCGKVQYPSDACRDPACFGTEFAEAVTIYGLCKNAPNSKACYKSTRGKNFSRTIWPVVGL